MLNDLIHFGIIGTYDEITGVGHRIVAGGEYFKESVVVDDKVVEQVEELAALAPLHNPGQQQVFVPFVRFCRTLRVFVCLIRRFIPQCKSIPTFIQFLKNIIQIIRFASTGRMGLAINMLLRKQQKCWVAL